MCGLIIVLPFACSGSFSEINNFWIASVLFGLIFFSFVSFVGAVAVFRRIWRRDVCSEVGKRNGRQQQWTKY